MPGSSSSGLMGHVSSPRPSPSSHFSSQPPPSTTASGTTDTTTANVVDAHKQVLAGSIAAFVSTVVCHPIDVLRTELQIRTTGTTARVCARRIRDAEGFLGFYKGLSAPLAAQAVYKA